MTQIRTFKILHLEMKTLKLATFTNTTTVK